MCSNCPAGGYSNTAGSTVCSQCTPGKYSGAAKGTACLACAAGTFTNTPAATACAACAVGLYSNSTGASRCETCAPGYTSAQCAACAAGSYKPLPGTQACLACPRGTYSDAPAATRCTDCQDGWYASATGATACSPCSAGFESNVYAGRSACVQCPVGWISTRAGSPCSQCDNGLGLVSLVPGATACVLCPVGQRANGPYACAACALGTYLGSGNWICPACAPGTYASAEGQSACSLCERGTYSSIQGSTACTTCDAGLYSSDLGSTTSTDCKPCTACAAGEYTFRTCSAWQDSTCSACTPCATGFYLTGQRCTRGNLTALGQNNLCLPCQQCPDGQFLSETCDGTTEFVACLNCTACSGETYRPCTQLSDTVCSETAQCRNEHNYTRPDWLPMNAPACRTGYHATAIYPVLQCARCPPHTVGDGLICRPCPGFKFPALSSTVCVCQGLTVATDDGQCECPVGHEFADDFCQPCAQDTYRNESTWLPDDWWTRYSTCAPCPPGETSDPGATECTQCPLGQYREHGQLGCQTCSASGHHALDSASASSCVACNSSCPAGMAADPCPDNAGLYACSDCPDPPSNATYYHHCFFSCNTGFYHEPASLSCEPCNSSVCEPGYNRSACSPWKNADCDTPCVDPTKPLWYSHYTSGCQWSCDSNYTLTTHAYGAVTVPQCVQDAPLGFWQSLFSPV